ncbi:MAG: hypothetical protein IT384_27055 [Deltaproteobacteria bacterium]|nr:hypothetical protein [Deltaproteobacteria bacterium]
MSRELRGWRPLREWRPTVLALDAVAALVSLGSLVAITAALAACSTSAVPSTVDAGPPDAGAPPDAGGVPCTVAQLQAAYRSGANEIDLDCDGRADWLLDRPNPTAEAVRETIDSNGDGRPDILRDRTGSTHILELDRNYDDRFDRRVEASDSVSVDGGFEFVMLEDRDLDGVMDHRTTYTIDPATPEVVFVFEEWDPDAGEWVETGRTTTTDSHAALGAIVTTSGPGACTGDQAAAIERALDKVEAEIDSCLASYDPQLASLVRSMAASKPIRVHCSVPTSPTESYCGYAAQAGKKNPAEIDIGIDPSVFTPNGGCPPVESVLFHELLHYAFGPHFFPDAGEDPNDRVYGCQRLCTAPGGNEPSPADCAACLATPQGDDRCKGKFDGACLPMPPVAFCPCPTHQAPWFSDTLSCEAVCPNEIGCFQFSLCMEITPPSDCVPKGSTCGGEGCGPCCGGVACVRGRCAG